MNNALLTNKAINYICALMASYQHDKVVPFKESGNTKKKQVEEMFDKIAFRYDFLNHFLSAGIDIGWRKKAIRQLKKLDPKKVLDVATGTGDVAILTHKLLATEKIIGENGYPLYQIHRTIFKLVERGRYQS